VRWDREDPDRGPRGNAARGVGDRAEILKERAEAHFREPIEKAVITVPAYFNDSQRQATKDAGRIAGLDVVRIVNEPTAASLAYGLHRLKEGVIAVYDLGGGTFDISILRVKDGVFEVLATNGNTHLGGDDFDRAIVVWLLDDILSEHGVYLGRDTEAMQELRLAAEAAKVRLSAEDRTTLTIPFEEFTYRRAITRAELEGLIEKLVDATLGPCRMAIADAGVAPSDIDEVVLVGGSTRVPLLRPASRSCSRRRRTANSTPTRSSRSAPRSRRTSWRVGSRACCSLT